MNDFDLSNPLHPERQLAGLQAQTRRHFLRSLSGGLGTIFLGTMAGPLLGQAAEESNAYTQPLDLTRDSKHPLSVLPPQFAARVKRVIYMHMAGAPSQLELFEYKPQLVRYDGQDCPASLLEGKRFAFITGIPKLLGPQYPFHQAGQNGHWISDRLPYIEKHIDELCFIRSMRTDQFNHAPAQL